MHGERRSRWRSRSRCPRKASARWPAGLQVRMTRLRSSVHADMHRTPRFERKDRRGCADLPRVRQRPRQRHRRALQRQRVRRGIPARTSSHIRWKDGADEQIALHGREDCIENIVHPALEDACEALNEILEEMEGQLEKEMKRIAELRIVRLEDPGASGSECSDVCMDVC